MQMNNEPLSILPAPRAPHSFASPMDVVVLHHFCFYKSSWAQCIVVVLAFLHLRNLSCIFLLHMQIVIDSERPSFPQ